MAGDILSDEEVDNTVTTKQLKKLLLARVLMLP